MWHCWYSDIFQSNAYLPRRVNLRYHCWWLQRTNWRERFHHTFCQQSTASVAITSRCKPHCATWRSCDKHRSKVVRDTPLQAQLPLFPVSFLPAALLNIFSWQCDYCHHTWCVDLPSRTKAMSFVIDWPYYSVCLLTDWHRCYTNTALCFNWTRAFTYDTSSYSTN